MLSISQLCGCQKGGNTYRYGSRCGSVETCCKARRPSRYRVRTHPAEAERSEPGKMAGLSLVNVKKIYPATNDHKKSKKKHESGEEKKAQLQVTNEGVVAVQEFNLDVADKEFIVLVGPSGCGKSTTLRMVAGLEEISSGELYIDGKLMNDVALKTGHRLWCSRTTRSIPI